MSTSSSQLERTEPVGFIRRWLWRHANTYVLAPSGPGVGNSAEEVFFALILAEQLGKRLLLIFPVPLPWPLRLPTLKAAVLDVQSPKILLRPAGIAIAPLRILVSLYFAAFRMADRVVRGLGRPFPPRLTQPRFGQESLWSPKDCEDHFDWQRVEAMEWDKWVNYAPTVSLPRATWRTGARTMRRLGIEPSDWFVCLHVRDEGFYADGPLSSPRNGSIESFALAIRHIADKGGKVVRMGGPSMRPCPKIPGLVDYALSGFASPRVDAYLMSRCQFYIGMQSGPYDLAPIFNKPRLVANMYNPVIGLPYRRMDAGFFKVVSTAGRSASWTEILSAAPIPVEELTPKGTVTLPVRYAEEALLVFRPDWSLNGAHFTEESPDRIVESVARFFESYASRNGDEDASTLALTPLLREFISSAQFSVDPRADVGAKYRFASRVTSHVDHAIYH